MARYAVSILWGLVLVTGCSKEHEVSSQWVPQPMVVDGHVDEWTELALNHFDEGNLSWGIVNDSENLYLLLVTWDEPLIRMLWMKGIALRFGESKDDTATCSVRVSGGAGTEAPARPPPTGEDSKGPPGASLPPPEDVKERPMPQTPPDSDTPAVPHGPSRPLDINVVSGNNSIAVETTGLKGIAGAASCAGPTCSYEIRIPLSVSGGVPCALTARPGEKLKIRAELIVPVMPQAPEGEGMGGGPPGRGMGGGMGGGPRGGMGGGPPGGMGGGMGGMGGGPPGGADDAGGDRSKAGRKGKGPPHGAGEHAPPTFETRTIALVVTMAGPAVR